MARKAQLHQEQLPDFKEIKQRFVTLNEQRLRRAKDDMRLRQLEFIELLPLLYHINHPLLPGYVNKNTVAGLPDYAPNSTALSLAHRLAKSFSYKKRAYRRFHIQAIYLMGSTGTIAYSSDSDFDIWICYDSSLTEEQLAELRAKSIAIERWAATLEIDANIFLVNPEHFSQGRHGLLSSEGSGSALHYLLLEEFYRTALLLAGRFPLWWLVPPEQEAHYDEFVADIKRKRYIHSRDLIDFGGLHRIPAEEFYGATLWLLYKGINSPYKSVIKILLMEAYASEYPHIDLLAMRFKRLIYQGENEINKIDPYLMMLHKVEQYLQKDPDSQRQELIRRSFYIKVNEKLSEAQNGDGHWRRQIISELTQAWGWTTSQLFIMDSKPNWNIPRVIRERNALIHELTHSYKFLSDFARNHSESSIIKPGDLTVLGRKLYAAFERKAGKIDIIYRGVTTNLFESHLSLHRLADEQGRHFWVIFSGVVNEREVATASPLKRAYNLIEVIAWCYFNKIITSRTVTGIYAVGGELTDKEFRAIVATLEKTFDDQVLHGDNIEALRQPAVIAQVVTILNAGADPFIAYTRRGDHLTSNRTDALRFGGRLENLTLSIDQIIVTSWQEVITLHYDGIEGMFKCMMDYSQWASSSTGGKPPSPNCVSFSCYRGTAIARRMTELFDSIFHCFYSQQRHPEARYLMAIEWDYYLLEHQDDHLSWTKLGDQEKLRHYLAQPTRSVRHLVFDPQAFHDDIVAHLFAQHRPGTVQCILQIQSTRVIVHVLDEMGSYLAQEMTFYDATSLIHHYQLFFQNIQQRMQYFRTRYSSTSPSPDIEFYYINKDRVGRWQLIEHVNNNLFKPQVFNHLQVLVEMADDELSLRIYCNDREFSTLEHGNKIYQAVAQHVLAQRNNNERYPIYITDIDLSRVILSTDSAEIQSIYYFMYKKQIEDSLREHLPKL
jgi:adenylate cyclase class 1